MNTLISAGILSNPKHIEVSTNVDMTGLFDPEEMRKIARNDLTSLDEKSLRKLNENTERNRLIVDTYLARRKEFGQTIVFAVDVLNGLHRPIGVVIRHEYTGGLFTRIFIHFLPHGKSSSKKNIEESYRQ